MAPAQQRQLRMPFWQKVPDVLFGIIPAICMLPFSILGLFFGGILGAKALSDVRESWPLVVLSILILMGLLGWGALITAIVRRWEGSLYPPSRNLKFGLWCALVSGIFFSLNPLDMTDYSLKSFLGGVSDQFTLNPFMAYVRFSPVVLTAVYLRRLQSGGTT